MADHTVPPDDPVFHLRAQISKKLFVSGDHFTLAVHSDAPAYLTLYCIDSSGTAYLLFPNAFNPDNRIPAGGDFTLPTEAERTATATYRVMVPEGQRESLEILRVILTARPFSTDGIRTFEDFPARWVTIPRSELEFIDIGYRVIAGE